MTTLLFYQQILRNEYSLRSEKNAHYSLRAFAKFLELDSGALSQIMSGKRHISYDMAHKLSSKLSLEHKDHEDFLMSAAEKSKDRKRKDPQLKKLLSEFRAPSVKQISPEKFQVISEWYHYAILEMTYLTGFQSDVKWIAKELGMPVYETKLAIERLLDLELLKIEEGRLIKTDLIINTGDQQRTSAAHRRRQRQVMEKSLSALENVHISKRNHTAMTMPIALEKLPEAKLRIQHFMVELCELLSSAETKEKVYELTVNLFPLQEEVI